jgi:hypothetical protein
MLPSPHIEVVLLGVKSLYLHLAALFATSNSWLVPSGFSLLTPITSRAGVTTGGRFTETMATGSYFWKTE